MKNMILLTVLTCFYMASFSQVASPFGGTLTCSINGNDWSGKITAAMYNKEKDYISMQFESTSGPSQINVSLKGVKQYMKPYIPYRDMYEMDYGAMINSDVYIYITYFPDKKAYLREYRMLNAQMALDKLNLESGTLELAFECVVATMKEQADRNRSIMENLEKLEIKNAATHDVVFINM